MVECYGRIASYLDGTYRGNRAMTRYEFAAGLNACLDRINELIAAGLAGKVSREDLAVLERFQEEFAAGLAALRGRVDVLDARVSELEANQFSTTTQLKGEVLFVQAFPIGEDDQFDDQAVFGCRARLNFDTSFTGNDCLRTRLQAARLFPGSGAGLGGSIGIIDSDDLGLSLDLGYVADDPADPSGGEGLFNGNYAASAQLTLTSDFIDLGLMYANSYSPDADEFDQGIYTLGDDIAASANTFGVQGNIKLGDTFEIGDRVEVSPSPILGEGFRERAVKLQN